MARAPLPLLARSFLPTWFALAGILVIQMVSLVLLSEGPTARPMAWSLAATVVAVVCVVSGVGAWAFPKVRAMARLIGAMTVTVVAMNHGQGAFDGAIPPHDELMAFYAAGAVLLAIGAWVRARPSTRSG